MPESFMDRVRRNRAVCELSLREVEALLRQRQDRVDRVIWAARSAKSRRESWTVEEILAREG